VKRLHLLEKEMDDDASLLGDIEDVIQQGRKIFLILPEGATNELDDQLWGALHNNNVALSKTDLDFMNEDFLTLEKLGLIPKEERSK
jgi:hypothetical protein